MIGPHLARISDRRADASCVGQRIPRLADTEAVELLVGERGDHLRRRNHDALDIAQRIDALRRKPVVQPHRVRAGRESLREDRLAAERRQRFGQAAVLGKRSGEPVRERDGLTVAVEHHQHGHVRLRTAEAELHAIDEPVERVRRVEIAREQLVAHGGP